MKLMKIFTLILTIISIVTLTSCTEFDLGLEDDNQNDNSTDIPSDETTEKYRVTWVNYDGNILEIDDFVEKGTIPTYDGKTPSRESSGNIEYTFYGWNPEVTEVVSDVTYQATYSEKIIEQLYTVTWIDYDGTVLEIDSNVKEGTTPTYDSQEPVKEGYTFNGWTPEISEVTADVTYQATYSEKIIEQVYTVTWVDYDGTVLETDTNVKVGTTPSYNSNTPTREGYIFNGWDPEINEVISDTTYQAIYIKLPDTADVLGSTPVLSQDGKTILYGLYPQTYVSDAALVAKLQTLQPTTNGWYLYEGNYYCKEVANVFKGESYTFDDGTAIVNGTEYWFKCEPISWNILSNDGISYYLVTTKLLDTHSFYNSYSNRTNNGQIIYANNYEQSDIRSWLNNYFYNTAFVLNNVFIKESTIDNSANTSDALNNKYSCANTLDKVFLPTYDDYLNQNYGFESNGGTISTSRECKTTDYARARGAWYNNTNANLKYNGTYWTRTATSEYSYCAWNVNSGGFLSTYAGDGTRHCVRPSIYIYFQE